MDSITQSRKDDSNAEGSEEGEILDSMDSEEENNMRQRIHELEAKNAELEKIARISSDYTNRYSKIVSGYNVTPNHHQIDYKNAARVPSDASPISSDEFEPIKKHTKRKKRTLCSEFCKHSVKNKCSHKRHRRSNDIENHRCKPRRSLKESHKKQGKVSLKYVSSYDISDDYFETISLDSDENTKEEKFLVSSDDEDNPQHLNREELRFALARDKTEDARKSKNLLKDRLYNIAFVELRKNESEAAFPEHISKSNHENEEKLFSPEKVEIVSQEEQELRLIALKSAVLKKHLARKKRNAEVAYSPTDFEPVAPQPKCVDSVDIIEEDLDELEDVMEISPMVSPKLAPSPSNEEEYKFGTLHQYEGDNNSVDMDIAESGSDDGKPIDENSLQTLEKPWSPITRAPFSVQEPQAYGELEHPFPVKYGIYVPEMQYFLNTFDDEEPPPPPPFFSLNTLSNNDSNTRNSVFERLGKKTEGIDNSSFQNHFDNFPLLLPEPVSNETYHISKSDKESDEEASALRAVLLSKLQKKNRQKDSSGVRTNLEQPILGIDTECMLEKTTVESVLQKALRRLKSYYSPVHTNTKENAMCRANETDENIYNDISEHCLPAVYENGTFASTPFVSHENSNSKSSNEDFYKPRSPYLEREVMLVSPQAVDSETSVSADVPDKNIPEDELISTLKATSATEASEENVIQVFSNSQIETPQKEHHSYATNTNSTENSLPNNIHKSKQTLSKNQSLLSTRAQPLSVKNTLNHSISAQLPQVQQPSSPLKKVRRTTKIIRRNKVINKEVTTSIKRPPSKTVSSPIMHPKAIIDSTVQTNAQSLKTVEKVPPKITVKKLIINLRKSETETSDEEANQNDNQQNADAKILDFALNSQLRSGYAASESTLFKNVREQTKPSTDAAFEMKLDSFLKNIRAKETQQNKKHSPIKHPADENAKTLYTPTAVRHLPLSSQDEYRRLVHRMKSLEKQKKSRLTDSKESSNTTEINSKKEKTREDELKALSSYEKSFAQTSENIVALLNQSLSLVAEAKRAKVAKLQHERRLKELRIEMEGLTAEVRQEELKLNSMKPHLGKSNQFLITLKKKSRELMHSANKLGKSVKGDNYSLINKAGDEINFKSKKLQTEIKLVNALKPDNIEQLLSVKDSEKDAKLSQQSLAKSSTAVASIVADQHPKTIATCVAEAAEDGSNRKTEEANILETCNNAKTENAQINPKFDGEVIDRNEKCDKAVLTLRPYVSPLEHLRNTFGYLNFNAIVCPYEMWGKCADTSCNYLHMTAKRKKGSELIEPFKSFLNLSAV